MGKLVCFTSLSGMPKLIDRGLAAFDTSNAQGVDRLIEQSIWSSVWGHLPE
ncbi:MAG: hypothetical protein AB8B48_09305 [Pseudomonadales bacterium]